MPLTAHRHSRSSHRLPAGAGLNLGCSIIGWAAFAVLLVGVGFFGVRTWNYYKLIRSGELVDLPQFTARLTASGGSGARVSSSFVDPKIVDAGDQPSLGAEAEPELTIVEFADFECPYSKESHSIVRRVAAEYGDRVKFVYRDFPVEVLHPTAFQAAVAAECAREQGKFWAYHDKLYANAPPFDFGELVEYAGETGMDERQFERCLVDERYRDRVTTDLRTAQTVGLRGTPTFFFNGQKVEGAIPEADLRRIIDRMLQ